MACGGERSHPVSYGVGDCADGQQGGAAMQWLMPEAPSCIAAAGFHRIGFDRPQIQHLVFMPVLIQRHI